MFSKKYARVKIGSTVVRAEIADSVLKQMKGLMFRKKLTRASGMLFVFNSEGYHAFWMAIMNFAIDMIWLSADKKIVDIKKNAEPSIVPYKLYFPREKSKYVLEVNGGFADKHKIKIGQKVSFKL